MEKSKRAKQLSGVYKIESVEGRKYYGSTNKMQVRWTNHLSNLRLDQHGNKMLQADYNRLGAENFSFSVIKYCPLEEAKRIEQQLITEDGKTNGYNILDVDEMPNTIGTNFDDCRRFDTADKIEAVRKRRHDKQETLAQLAEIFDCDTRTISAVIRYKGRYTDYTATPPVIGSFDLSQIAHIQDMKDSGYSEEDIGLYYRANRETIATVLHNRGPYAKCKNEPYASEIDKWRDKNGTSWATTTAKIREQYKARSNENKCPKVSRLSMQGRKKLLETND